MNTNLIDWGKIKHKMNQFVPVLTGHFSANAVQDKPKQYLGILCAFNLWGVFGTIHGSSFICVSVHTTADLNNSIIFYIFTCLLSKSGAGQTQTSLHRTIPLLTYAHYTSLDVTLYDPKLGKSARK